MEFALVSSLLFTVLIGMLQYGLYFNDALGARNGVREAVRQGVVRNFTFTGCSGDNMTQLKCYTNEQIDAISGQTYVKIVKPASWTKGQPLTVCAVVHSDGVVGLVPLPNKGYITTKTRMSIEEAGAMPTGAVSDTLPSVPGLSWTWCS